MAAIAQPLHHREPHVADADHTDRSRVGAHRHQLCINGRLRAIDISSPRPRPKVTIAVPP